MVHPWVSYNPIERGPQRHSYIQTEPTSTPLKVCYASIVDEPQLRGPFRSPQTLPLCLHQEDHEMGDLHQIFMC
jgi:hypothetical protein